MRQSLCCATLTFIISRRVFFDEFHAENTKQQFTANNSSINEDRDNCHNSQPSCFHSCTLVCLGKYLGQKQIVQLTLNDLLSWITEYHRGLTVNNL